MYYLVFGSLYLVSRLPFWVLYRISDFFYFVFYRIIGYRKKVVHANLALAFPEKSESERKTIAKKFYRNFIDNWIEAVKFISVSEATIRKRISTDYQAFDDIYKQGRPVQTLMGHLFNWEWGNAGIPLNVGFKCLVAYSPLSSKVMDRLFIYLRQRFGCVMLPFNEMSRAMLPYRRSQYLLALVSDQNPPNPLKSYWLNFMGVPTAFLKGPEKGARMGNIPVVFLPVIKVRRGYYHMKAILLDNDPKNSAEGEITRKYVAELEAIIQRNPELYLWSHKRWKNPWKEDYRKLWIGN